MPVRTETLPFSLRRHRNSARHVRMKTTEIIDFANMLQCDATDPLRGDGDIPVLVARCRCMRNEIVAHPLNRIANTGRDLRRRKLQL